MSEIFLNDSRVECLSGIGTIDVETYLSRIEDVYKKNGGIANQRTPLKTKTGINIRIRMVDDIRKGAILPPIVIGAVVTPEVFDKARQCSDNNGFEELFRSLDSSKISVIDGMQRTTALLEANAADVQDTSMAKVIRIDLWLASNINSLVYRMLVLNTGQVPWDIKRQLETIYSHILDEIKDLLPDISVLNIDEKERRSSPGQYRSTRIIELFLAFTARKPHLELKEKVAEDFARMDATEATANNKTLPAFFSTMEMLAKLDQAFSKKSMKSDYQSSSTRFKEGKDIFTSAPASIGFAAAASQFLLGRPGYAFSFDKLDAQLEKLKASVFTIIGKLESPNDDADFIDFLALNEKISKRSGKIGEFEREFFFRAFSHMFENADDLDSLTPCWLAY